eukprot:scaffold21161_cov96-Cyclotella_meneghiniana.AAC.5
MVTSTLQIDATGGVGAETEFVENQPAEVDEWEIFVFGRVGGGGAKLEEKETAMTPPGESALTLGCCDDA